MRANDYDIVVIGAGVAGLNAAIAAARHGARTMIVDMLGAGGQVINVDRIDNFPGPAEGMSGFELGPMLQIQADEAGVEFALDMIETVSKTDTGFRIAGADLDLTAGAVIIAAGSAKRTLGIPGEAEFEGRGVSHCASCDGPLMRGKQVCIIGGGDSALDEALALVPHAARITVIHRGSRLRASAALQAKASEASNIEVRPNTIVTASSFMSGSNRIPQSSASWSRSRRMAGSLSISTCRPRFGEFSRPATSVRARLRIWQPPPATA
jgi:thioredoxin reductase (NADPH)